MKLKISPKNIILGVLFLTFSFLFILAILEQSLSVEFFKSIIEGMVALLWVIIPIITTVASLLVVGFSKESLNSLLYFIVTLLLISNMFLLFVLTVQEMGLGILFIGFTVWGSTLLFIIALLVKLLSAYFVQKNFKELLGHISKIKIFKSFFLSVGVIFLLFQIFIVGSAISAYKAVKVLDTTKKKEYSLWYFYRPLSLEIRLDNGLRWSYGRVKFVGKSE